MFNFECIKNEYIDDIKSECYLYEHLSGAKLIYIKNNDKNKVFSATFRTLPTDNTGAAHIVEHSVLCGSKNYPIKDPFNALEKGSLHTYLNAMTFNDKTIYPIASTNENDFINLMKVYLDAVFFTNIYDNEAIFLQEGWNYGENGFNGVVYNEMKGAFSSIDKKIDFEIKKFLYEDTNYKYYSGGLPEDIIKLSYNDFLNFHKKYYSPSNCILYLYGNVDINNCMNIIDSNYLSKFENNHINIEYKKQPDFLPKKFTTKYHINKDEEIENKNYMSLGVKINAEFDYSLIMAFDILTTALLHTNYSPVKNALIDLKIAQNVSGYFDSGIFEPALIIKAEKSNLKDIDKFNDILFDTFNNIIKNKLDKDLIKGCVNKFKFYIKEADFGYRPKGLYYNIMLMRSFLYYDYSFKPLKISEIFKNIDSMNFEYLIQHFIVENKNRVLGLFEADYEEEINIKHNYTVNDFKLKQYQKSKDTFENLDKINLINLEDISRDIFNIGTVIDKIIVFNPIDDDISYIDLLFDTRVIPIEDVSYIGIIKYILGKLDTEKYNISQLSSYIDIYLGGFYTEFLSFEDNNGNYFPKFRFSVKALNQNNDYVFELLKQIIFKTKFKDKNRIKSLIIEYKNKIQKLYISQGASAAVYRSASCFFERFNYDEKINGIEFYNFINHLTKDIDNNIDYVIQKIEYIVKLLFNKNNIIIAISSNHENYHILHNNIKSFVNSMRDEKNKIFSNIGKKPCLNEAFITNSDIVFNSLTSRLNCSDFKFNGYVKVLKKIIESDYIWDKIRLEAGAYGGGFNIRRSGLIYAYSYRDPNVLKTYNYFEDICNYVDSLKLNSRQIQQYIIGTINNIDRPIKNSQLNYISLERYIGNISYDKLAEEKEEILGFSNSHLKILGNLLYEYFSSGVKCSLGNKSKIYKNQKIFDKIKFLC